MKSFDLRRVECGYLVLSTDYARLEEYVSQLTIELNRLHFEGKLVFDFLLSNGDNSSRFFEAYFNTNGLVKDSIVRLKSVNSEITETSHAYYVQHSTIIKHGVLTSRQVARLFGEIVNF
jgi:hypothetical protein